MSSPPSQGIPARATASLSPAKARASAPDDVSIPEPKKRGRGTAQEFFSNAFLRPFRKIAGSIHALGKPNSRSMALDVDPADEVLDSSWFTNRILTGSLSPQEIARGAAVNAPPDFSGDLIVLGPKPGGVTPGFVVQDRVGVVWFLKFDPPGYPEMTTAAEVISSRIFWAAGYNVPEEWIATLHPGQLRLDAHANVVANGERRPMTMADVKNVLRRASGRPDGSYRVVASRILPGRLKGGFDFEGTRPDDPNDRIPHEQRRELRALRVLCAWLGHEDIKSGNTVSAYVEADGRKFLRHYLWDFGSSLGSDGVRPNSSRSGNAYGFDYARIGKKVITLGLWQEPWERNAVPVRYPSVGRFDSGSFRPEAWRPTFPNAAFDHMTAADGWWGARLVAAFTDEHIRAAVRAGRLSNADAEEFLARTLIERRERIKQYWFARVVPLQSFSVESTGDGSQEIRFADMCAAEVPGAAPRRYFYQFFATGSKRRRLSDVLTLEPGGTIRVTPEILAAASAQAIAGKPVLVDLEVRAGPAKPVYVYFLLESREKRLRLLGFEHAAS